MQQVAFNELPTRWPTLFRQAMDQQERFEIQNDSGETVVMMNGQDYRGIIETLYITNSKANIAWLQESIRQYHAGEVKQIDVTPYMD